MVDAKPGRESERRLKVFSKVADQKSAEADNSADFYLFAGVGVDGIRYSIGVYA